MVPDDTQLVQALRWVLDIDPAAVVADVEKRRSALGAEDGRQLAQRFVDSYARKAGAEGFVLGLGSNPLVMVGTSLGDVACMLRFYAYLTAAIGYLGDPRYFDDPDWKDDALVMLAGPKAISRAMKDAGLHLGQPGSKVLIKKYLGNGVLRTSTKYLLRWFGKKVTQRMIFTKAVPFVGGVVGGSWNYLEMKLMGSRIISYHFDGTLGPGSMSSSGPSSE